MDMRISRSYSLSAHFADREHLARAIADRSEATSRRPCPNPPLQSQGRAIPLERIAEFAHRGHFERLGKDVCTRL
jgi:hypothetical protein